MPFDKYLDLKTRGATALEIYALACSDGLGEIPTIRMLREVFGLDLVSAKRVMVKGATGRTLDEQQERVVKEVEVALGSQDKDRQ